MKPKKINFDLNNLDPYYGPIDLKIKNSEDLVNKDQIPDYWTIIDAYEIKGMYHTNDSNFYIDKKYAEDHRFETLTGDDGKPILILTSTPGNVLSNEKVFKLRIFYNHEFKQIIAHSFPNLITQLKIAMLVPTN
jgi:hypothetical protein